MHSPFCRSAEVSRVAALGSRTLDLKQLVSDGGRGGGAPGNDNRRACTLRTGLCRGGRGKLSPAAREPHSIHAVAPRSRMSQRDTPSSQLADPCSLRPVTWGEAGDRKRADRR